MKYIEIEIFPACRERSSIVSDWEVLFVSRPESDGESIALTNMSVLSSSMASSFSVLRSTSLSDKVSVITRVVSYEEYLCLVWSAHNNTQHSLLQLRSD